MPIFGGPVDTLLIAGMLAVAVAAWLLKRRRYLRPRSMTDYDGIDREVLAAAEREVRDLDRMQEPEDDLEDDDWGPGTVHRPHLR
jgi:hypothetical protein